jgi:hypothetical protein
MLCGRCEARLLGKKMPAAKLLEVSDKSYAIDDRPVRFGA